ncbi:MobA/MobL family protein [Bradyrhizobium brasilense]|uniref:MobA/MobL family protein n=1 Tax=Bradyrhizobium brasilense TaxID=1419277 RepID=A0A1G6RSX0_9BRAD|nr:MobA/MobL family protein [Bradyrhizobium brasilense]
MAIYHLHVKVIGRKAGSSAVASAAYRSASRLRDHRFDRSHEFSAKRSVIRSEELSPEGGPEWSDRERPWHDVEVCELSKDAQLSHEVECIPPREMTQVHGIRDFVQAEFVGTQAIAAPLASMSFLHVMKSTGTVEDRDLEREDIRNLLMVTVEVAVQCKLVKNPRHRKSISISNERSVHTQRKEEPPGLI